ncbi:phosphatidylinositol kinase, putative [Leishmania donovani]|uniref:Phosphatidylinositol kinase, putative n=1 Tax=Leishmania donovani TaxID=5661 RepID=A0A3Q8IJE4_LEIDO|nr:phosphatidylinositol kinase, putative [Leishmania donovani]
MSDAAAATAAAEAATTARTENPVDVCPATPPPTNCIGSVWLGVYDRVSHTRFRIHIEDPVFLCILSNAVVPAAESDGSLPFEIQEFVEYLDAYERERLRQAYAARRGPNNSGGAVGSGRCGVHGDPAAAAATAGSCGAGGAVSGSGAIYSGVSGIPSMCCLNSCSPAGGPVPRKLEETLRETLSENSDFFFRVSSVAYHLDPNPQGASACTSASASAGSGVMGNAGVGARSPRRGEGLASAAAGGVASLLSNTIAAASATGPPPRRNYSVHSGYSAAFHLCGRLFADVYRDHCRALAQKIASGFSGLRVEDCVKFRKAVWSGFHLKALEPYRSGARSESNLELRWVSEKIKDDQHLFPSRGVAPQQQSSHVSRLVDATLSYVANARLRGRPSSSVGGNANSSTGGNGAAGAGGAGAAGKGGGGAAARATVGSVAEENELNTFGLTKLLHNPSWQKDDESSDSCPSCGRAFISLSRPLGTRAHHCRSCGIRLCVFCITKRAHYSFAKLAKPGSSDEAEERLVCDTCYKEYETVSQLHYLGALFAFAGLGFSDLVLCRTVNEQWREAAELCISEYRLLLHNCDADLHSVKTPVGILLQNSLFLLLGDGPTSSIPVVHHPEAALLLLKFIATENLWVPDASYYFIWRLSSSVLNRADTVLTSLPSLSSSAASAVESKHHSFQLPVVPNFSHWHLFCTAFCSKIGSSYFFVKCAELLCAAPTKVYDAYVASALERMTRVYLSTTALWKRLAEANQATAASFAARTSSPPTTAPLPLPMLSDVTEGQVVTVWLLDMLHKDALVPAQRRRFQQLLEQVIPTVAGSSLSLVFIMLLSLQSTYSYYGYDEDLFGLWRTRIVAEVGRKDPVARDRVVATLDFFHELDRFCAQSSVVSQTSVVGWIVAYCRRCTPKAPASATGAPGEATTPSARRGYHHSYIDLPHPILNPFKPYIVLKSIRLSGVKVAPNAASKPTWLAFSTWSAAEHLERDTTTAAKNFGGHTLPTGESHAERSGEGREKGTGAAPTYPSTKTSAPVTSPVAAVNGVSPELLHDSLPQECMFLYKRENVERDQLMCISSRLLQMLLSSEIGNAEMLDYSVLPLSCDSGLIEKAEGRELSNLDNMDIASYVLQRGTRSCINFLASAKLFLLLNYIFSIGDRHKGNVLIGTNGALLHIDFRFIFSEKTFVEKLARSTVRIDDAFLAAVEQCQQRQCPCFAGPSPAAASSYARGCTSPPGSPGSGGCGSSASPTKAPEPSSAEIREAFFSSAAEWFVHVRPFAAVFYELWLYAVHRHTVPYNDAEMLNMLNTLFDRHASQTSSASKFSTTMKESVNVCRLKDVTHSSAEVLRTFADQVSRRVSESSVDAMKMMGSMWSSWWSRGG